jgi:hypothetical protein
MKNIYDNTNLTESQKDNAYIAETTGIPDDNSLQFRVVLLIDRRTRNPVAQGFILEKNLCITARTVFPEDRPVDLVAINPFRDPNESP